MSDMKKIVHKDNCPCQSLNQRPKVVLVEWVNMSLLADSSCLDFEIGLREDGVVIWRKTNSYLPFGGKVEFRGERWQSR